MKLYVRLILILLFTMTEYNYSITIKVKSNTLLKNTKNELNNNLQINKSQFSKQDSFQYSVNVKKSETDFSNYGVETINPQIVNKVFSNFQKSNPDIINESNGVYYDGGDIFRDNNLECKGFSGSPHDCINSSRCGWCKDNNTCVRGDKRGPFRPLCSENGFLYFIPFPDWNPFNTQTIKPIVNLNIDTNLTFHD